MKPRAHDPRRLDVAAFAAADGRLEGSVPLSHLGRLQDVAVHAVGDVQWAAAAELRTRLGDEPQTWLTLSAHATVPLECQRCLQAVVVPIEVRRSFRFVRDENQAARLDAESEDDVLELTRSFDLIELVEDELLLALPLVPRHDACSPAVPMHDEAGDAPEESPNPFAALQALKRGRPQ